MTAHTPLPIEWIRQCLKRVDPANMAAPPLEPGKYDPVIGRRLDRMHKELGQTCLVLYAQRDELLALLEECAGEFYYIAHSSGDPADPSKMDSASMLYRAARAAISKAEGDDK